MHVFIFELFILSHSSLGLSLCQNHTVLIIVSLQQVLKSGSGNPSNMFFSKYVSALLSLVIPKTFQNQLVTYFVKSLVGFLLGLRSICILIQEDCHLNNIESSNSGVWYVTPFILIFFNFSQSYFVVFNVQAQHIFC